MTAAEGGTACPRSQAPRQRTTDDHRCPATVLLADPRVRLGLGAAVLLATAMPVRTDRIGRRETEAFRAVNSLSDSFYLPTWMIMQFGALGAAHAAAAAAWAAGDRPLAWRLAAGGSATWALSKLVKRTVHRPRPASLLPGVRLRGPEASGLGYLSGHAGVAAALCAASFHRLSPAGRAVTLGIVPIVGLSREYVGAHLPLDIVGGAALGVAVDAAVELVQRMVTRRRDASRATSEGSCARRTSGRTSRGPARRPSRQRRRAAAAAP
jgi:membrane-associated phospholipid phosphatase